MFRNDDVVAERRQAREEQAANQANLMATESLAKSTGAVTPAIKAMQDANAGKVAA
jgi:hypothetical protein